MRNPSKNMMFAVGTMLALMSATASAGVIYTWHNIDTTQYLYPLSGELEVTNAAWRLGSVDDYDYSTASDPTGDANSPIIHSLFIMGIPGPLSPAVIDIDPITGQAYTHLSASLGFNHFSPLLTGSLHANNSESDYRMVSNGDGSLWTITYFNSDKEFGGPGCYSTGGCSGATGFWSIDPSTLPVPEPGGLALIGFGVVLLGAELRRRASRRRPPG